MTYDELIKIVTESNLSDWNIISCYGNEPSYKSRFEFYDVLNDQKDVLREESHSMVACYKPNISISIAFGLIVNADYKEEWLNNFPDHKASTHYLDLFFNNSLVGRIMYVKFDGGSKELPLPKSSAELTVKKIEFKIIMLIASMELNSDNYSDYFERAGFSIEI
ncbi:MAG: hypothetical protein ABH873_01200 [Candidatus Firestonebacteria bacterium]